MKKLTDRFGVLILASFAVMAIGVILFLLTPLLYTNFGIDTDIIGVTVFAAGLAIWVIGWVRRKSLHGWKLALSIVLAVVLLLPLLQLIITSIYYFITGKALGS